MDKQVEELKKLWSNKRQLAFQALNLAMIVLSALMIWKSLMVVTKSESPVVVVLRCVRWLTQLKMDRTRVERIACVMISMMHWRWMFAATLSSRHVFTLPGACCFGTGALCEGRFSEAATSGSAHRYTHRSFQSCVYCRCSLDYFVSQGADCAR